MKNFIKYLFLGIWTLYCVLGVIKHFTNYGLDDWIIVILITLLPYFIIWFLNRKSRKIKTSMEKNSIPKPIATGIPSNYIKSVSSTGNLYAESESVLPKSEETTNKQYVETGNVIYHADGKPISDEEVPYLMQVGYEETIKQEHGSTNIKFCRTHQEEELSFRFEMNHGNDIEKHTRTFENAYRQAYSENDLNKKIVLLQNVIDIYEKGKKWFYRTKGGTIYFQDYYEHLHNSTNDDFSYIDSVKKCLEYCVHKRDCIIPEILRLTACTNGIMQKDIYSYFPDESKSDIQKIIRELANDNIISRTKKGSSYLLVINQH